MTKEKQSRSTPKSEPNQTPVNAQQQSGSDHSSELAHALDGIESTASETQADAPEPKWAADNIPPGFPIVGIGASAGGLEALELFIGALPAKTGIGYVLVVHLDPTHTSILSSLLQRHAKIPVCQIEDQMPVQKDHVYVIPPNKDLAIHGGILNLMEVVQPRGGNLPIDSFFRSLAQDQKRNAISIVLSGTGSDGTLGVKAIKAELGMVMVQDEQSAKYDGMPRSAIDTGLVDYVLPPEKMPERLLKFTQHANTELIPESTSTSEGPIPHALQMIFAILRTRTHHDFSQYKKNTICRRIERRMNVHQIDDITTYVRFLQDSEREAEILFKEFLIGVTNFFRDPDAFEVLQTKVFPSMLAEYPEDDSFRVWVPGCASGEEAYSLAILLHGCMEQTGRHLHFQIFGTDIDESAIKVARAGIYPASIATDVGPERIKRYFTKEDDGRYRVKKMIREMLVFAPQDLIKDPPFTRLNLLSCRNLLIYLGAELQRKLLPVFHYSLKPNGILFLGSSETIGQATDLFTLLDKKWRIFRRKPSTSGVPPVLDFPPQRKSPGETNLRSPETNQMAEDLSSLQLVETILRQADTPPCVIIDGVCNVIYIHGRTGRFLEPARGKANMNILEMARPGLKAELAAAIQQVSTNKQPTIRNKVLVEGDAEKVHLNLTVKPILEQTQLHGLMMVVFDEVPFPASPQKAKSKRGLEKNGEKDVAILEQELQNARENLQSTIEEFETSNEELKSTNEELQSTNEELQSTNEELETSKEELQSLNEESSTVNAELQARIEELSKINDDMKNLLDSTKIATIFLDTELRVRRFTPEATDIIPLKSTDIGRPITHLASRLVNTDLTELGLQVLDDLVAKEAEVEIKDYRIYVMRVRPYRTVNNVIDGVVITFQDITQRKQAEKALGESEERYRLLFELASDSIVLLDPENGSFAEYNPRTHEHLGYTREEFAKLTLADIQAQETAGKAQLSLDNVTKNGSKVFQTKHKAKDGTIHDVQVKAKAIKVSGREFLLCTWQDLAPSNSDGRSSPKEAHN